MSNTDLTKIPRRTIKRIEYVKLCLSVGVEECNTFITIITFKPVHYKQNKGPFVNNICIPY